VTEGAEVGTAAVELGVGGVDPEEEGGREGGFVIGCCCQKL